MAIDEGADAEGKEVALPTNFSANKSSMPSTMPTNRTPPTSRTPIPSEFQQTISLMRRNFKRDQRLPGVWAARTLLGPLMVMLYTIGFFLGYEDTADGTRIGDFILHDGRNWPMPDKIFVAGNNADLLEDAAEFINSNDDVHTTVQVESSFNDKMGPFSDFCEDKVGNVKDAKHLCVYLNITSESLEGSLESLSSSSLDSTTTIYYGGGKGESPEADRISGAQYLFHSALWNVTAPATTTSDGAATTIPFTVSKIQSIPTTDDDDGIGDWVRYVGMAIGVLIALALVGASGYLIAPIVTEQVQEVHLAFVRTGVRLRTYVLQWLLFYSLHSILTAIALTALAVWWNLYPKSSSALVFVSHYMALIQMNAFIVAASQVSTQEEMAQGIPFLGFLASMAIAVPLVVLDVPTAAVSACSSLSPFIAIVNYSLIYFKYDYGGYDTGITTTEQVVESGLLGSYIGSMLGIVFYLAIIFIFTSPDLRNKLFRNDSRNAANTSTGDSTHATPADNFEPLPDRETVLLEVRGLMQTYRGQLCKRAEPVDVLRGLDLDVCRGSVLGLLGHNGSGKSTTLRILSGEQPLQDGHVSYNFHDGTVEMDASGGTQGIRGKIGVCPQHNNLLGDESCRETLQLLAGLRGDIRMEQGQSVAQAIDAEVDRLIEQIGFTSPEDADKPVKTYSGGMKRKVCIAIALLGNPEVVFLDEPTAGIDPYNRRTIWDMIIEAKAGRSIILCSHHLEEVDLLSDRVAILKKGQIIACGSTLFLKHHFGAGYSLRFDSQTDLDVSRVIREARQTRSDKPGTRTWDLAHGTEPSFPRLLRWLEQEDAANIEVELTTLEQVFLATGKEDASERDSDDDDDGNNNDNDNNNSNDNESSISDGAFGQDDGDERHRFLAQVWGGASAVEKRHLSFWEKFFLVSKFMMQDSWRQPEAITINVAFPLAYMIGGMVAVYLTGEPDEVERVFPDPIPISPLLMGKQGEFFGLEDANVTIPGILPIGLPATLEDFHDGEALLGGYWSANETLQYNDGATGFSTHIGAYILTLANFGRLDRGDDPGIKVNVQHLPYDTDPTFRIDFIVLPIALVYGFTGMVFSMIDILTLKANNIVALFRVAGINEWTVNLGVMFYKCASTFLPFFVIAIILGFSLQLVLFGNGLRWLATIALLLLYAYSATPMGLIISKRFITKDFDSAKSWFPTVYFTVVSMPYVTWSMAYQLVDSAESALLVVGDFLCIIPPVAFQRGLGAVIDVSLRYDDRDLYITDVFKFETRVMLAMVLMLVVGTLEWIYLRRLTTTKPMVTKLEDGDEGNALPELTDDADVLTEREKSLESDDGINAREVVKVFNVEMGKGAKSAAAGGTGRAMKRAVKGVSFGIKKNEIFVLLGPNGAGKTTLMSILAGEYSPEHGTATIDERIISMKTRGVDHIFERSNVSWCPQHDSLFPGLTVQQHLEFYARVRGLVWDTNETKGHVNSIVKLLGLSKHVDKRPSELSGGYKRRVSLGIAMIGYPSSMLVDECTTGLDPGARHLVWEALRPDLVNEEYQLPAVLFSTHYMDEAEALATRIGIMIDGELVATGTLDRLQQRFCRSYFVEIALDHQLAERGDRTLQARVLALMNAHGMQASIYESLPFNFKIQIPYGDNNNVMQLASIFDLLERHKEEFRIKFYSVANMSLEQIFVDLSKKQFDGD
eukprot:CAMPEP_0119550624 /NCGR_PEP_ID=MMETSP1352-20130426/4101_1 /TAXON_ID=265584 /ORGANISM="Stauroneis constricta, Strain CCMP1120" /LENGTH=1679 /DNA_ID=CAMNT_0007596523 /DNA_START=80 /DNA_END=5119 /DNA_ORIENTATION=+